MAQAREHCTCHYTNIFDEISEVDHLLTADMIEVKEALVAHSAEFRKVFNEVWSSHLIIPTELAILINICVSRGISIRVQIFPTEPRAPGGVYTECGMFFPNLPFNDAVRLDMKKRIDKFKQYIFWMFKEKLVAISDE